MIQLNIGDHVSSEPGYIAFPRNHWETMRWARRRAQWIASHIRTANPYYTALPGGRTLTALLADSSVWLNFNTTFTYYGETNMAGGKEVAIGRLPFRIGRWTVLATLIHELAHVNGAPGGASPLAERAVHACGMGRQSERDSGVDDPRTPYDPTIVGAVNRPPGNRNV